MNFSNFTIAFLRRTFTPCGRNRGNFRDSTPISLMWRQRNWWKERFAGRDHPYFLFHIPRCAKGRIHPVQWTWWAFTFGEKYRLVGKHFRGSIFGRGCVVVLCVKSLKEEKKKLLDLGKEKDEEQHLPHTLLGIGKCCAISRLFFDAFSGVARRWRHPWIRKHLQKYISTENLALIDFFYLNNVSHFEKTMEWLLNRLEGFFICERYPAEIQNHD